MFEWFWAAGAVVLWAAAPLGAATPLAGSARSAAYSVVSHGQSMLGLAAAFAVTAGVYLALSRVFRASFRRGLAWGHFGLMAVGAALITAPFIVARAAGTPAPTWVVRVSPAFNTLTMAGYLMTVAGFVLFLVLLGEVLSRAFRRAADTPPNAP
jgi:heme/copper-type cytochrome/quinol oxidase subunit 1